MIILGPGQLAEHGVQINPLSRLGGDKPEGAGPFEIGYYSARKEASFTEHGVAITYSDGTVEVNAVVPLGIRGRSKSGFVGQLYQAAEDLSTNLGAFVDVVAAQTGREVLIPDTAPPLVVASQYDFKPRGSWTGLYTRLTTIRQTGSPGTLIAHDGLKPLGLAPLTNPSETPLSVGPDSDRVQVAAVSIANTLNRFLAAEVVALKQ